MEIDAKTVKLVRNLNEFRHRLKTNMKRLPQGLTLEFFKQLSGFTQANKVLWHLLEYGSITNNQCRELYRINHAPSVIRELRKRFQTNGSGYRIENKDVSGFNFWGDYCHYVEYTLIKPEEIEECA